MPGPAVYVAAVVGGVAAVVAFKQFVYEPLIAPKLEQWAEEFVAKRRAQRARRMEQPVQARSPGGRGQGNRRTSDDVDKNMAPSIELERLINSEVQQWRDEVGTSSMRRRTTNMLDNNESNVSIPYQPMSPTHVVFDPSAPSSPASTISLRSGARSLGSLGSSSVRPAPPNPEMTQLRTASSPAPLTPVSMSARSMTLSTASVSSRTSSPASMYNSALGPSALEMPVSAPMSPFSDAHAALSLDAAAAVPQNTSAHSEFDFLSPSDDDMLSLDSGASSVGSVRELDVLSDFDAASEASWTSVNARR